MALTDKERSREYRIRQHFLRDAVWIDVKREIVLRSGVMSPAQYDNPVERRRILSEYLDEELQQRAANRRRHAVTLRSDMKDDPR